MEVLLIVLFLAVVVAAMAYGAIQEKKRREMLAAWAAKNGLSFSMERNTGYEDQFPDFKRLKAGDGDRYAKNIMSGSYHNRSLRAFDYHYITRSTDSKGRRRTTHHNFSAIIVESDIPLKLLGIRPEGFLDRIGSAFGFEDINFESAEFSRKFKVAAPERKWAYDVLHARAIEFLMTQPAFSMQFGNGNWVMLWTSGTWKPEQFDVAIRTVEGLLDLFPDYLKQQQRDTAAGGEL